MRMKAMISFSAASEMRIPFSISRSCCFSSGSSQLSTTSAARGCGSGCRRICTRRLSRTSFTQVPTGSKPWTSSRTFGSRLLVRSSWSEDLGRLLVEPVLVEVADEKLADAQPLLGDGLQGELRQQVLLEALRLGQGALDELPARVARRLAVRPRVPGVGGVVEPVPSPSAAFPGGQGVQGDGGPVLLHLEGGVLLQLLLDGGLQVLQGQRHEPDRLVELRGHLELLDLFQDRSLGLHEASGQIVSHGRGLCQLCSAAPGSARERSHGRTVARRYGVAKGPCAPRPR